MEVTVISRSTLTPSRPPPPAHGRVPLTVFDRAAFDLHVPTLYAFRAPTPTNHALRRGLAHALRLYPHLAGRMGADERGRPCFLLNDAGALLVEARVDAPLAGELPLEAGRDLAQLHPPVEDVPELLQVQLTRYTCGGIVIGVTSHHRVADGQSMSGFLLAWAAAVRHGAGGTAVTPPYHDRAAVVVPRNPPRCDHNHRAVEFRAQPSPIRAPEPAAACTVENLVVRFSANFVADLKSAARNPRCSTFECLLAHLWKKITAARGVRGEGVATQVRVAVNGRARMKPAVPMEYFGNMVLWAYPRLPAAELLAGSLAHNVRAIHEAIGRVDDAYFRSFIDFGAMMESGGSESSPLVATAPETGNSLCPNLEVDSWLRFNFHDLDFGTGKPCAMIPPNLPVEGLMVFVPSCKEEGGVDVFLALSPEHADEFKRICYTVED